MILDHLADGGWHEMPFDEDHRAGWSALWRLTQAGKVEAMSREDRSPTERQLYRRV